MHLAGALERRPASAIRIIVATVDHGLRPEAADEARWSARGGERWRFASSDPDLDEAQSPPPVCRSGRGTPAMASWSNWRSGYRRIPSRHRPYARRPGRNRSDAAVARHRGSPGFGGMAVRAESRRHPPSAPLARRPQGRPSSPLCTSRGLALRRATPRIADERFARVRWRRLMPALAAGRPDRRAPGGLARRARRAEEALDRQAAEAFGRARLVRRARASLWTRQSLPRSPSKSPCGCLLNGPVRSGAARQRAGASSGSKPASSGCARLSAATAASAR